jgi:hypothetical protein
MAGTLIGKNIFCSQSQWHKNPRLLPFSNTLASEYSCQWHSQRAAGVFLCGEGFEHRKQRIEDRLGDLGWSMKAFEPCRSQTTDLAWTTL